MITVNVGKNGLTATMVAEIKRQLERHGSIRVKLLPNVEDRKEVSKALGKQVNATVESHIGFIVVLKKK
jgi:RNA-binding protein